MQITMTIPDEVAPQIVDGVCAATNYDAASGKSKDQWAQEVVTKFLKETAKRGQVKLSMTSIAATIDPVAITYQRA